MRTYLELHNDATGTHRYYEVIQSGKKVRLHYGKIGLPGTWWKRTLESKSAAIAYRNAHLRRQERRGYKEALPPQDKPPSSPTEKARLSPEDPVTQESRTLTLVESGTVPILWKFFSRSSAYGLFVDDRGCWVANQGGKLFELTHQGEIRRRVILPKAVKCLVADESWLYAGCSDGKVYDVTGRIPHESYSVSGPVDIYWMDIDSGSLAISDSQGNLTTFNHESEELWQAKSSGNGGWMARTDAKGVYHGHSRGVTAYDWESGEELWHHLTPGGVLFGWQTRNQLFVAANRWVQCLDKVTGEAISQMICDTIVYSCTATEDGQFYFAGDSSSYLYCFNAKGERLWKLRTKCGDALTMQAWGGYLFFTTGTGVLACIDASPEAVERVQKEGYVHEIKEIRTVATTLTTKKTPSTPKIERTKDSTRGVVVECFREGSKLRVRVCSQGYQTGWHVQFPRKIRKEGAKFVVEGVKEASRGGFYRTVGEIKLLES